MRQQFGAPRTDGRHERDMGPLGPAASSRYRGRVDVADAPVGRLAPSPTGRLHLGHARTFALAWAHVRKRGGRVLLRLEDLDQTRCRPELVQGVLRDLEWLGLDWDGSVLLQSERLDALRAAAARLEETGAAYACVCTRADLQSAASAPQRGVDEQRYPGTCRGRFESAAHAERASGRKPALRFRVPPGELSFIDGIAGQRSFDVAQDVGDFVIANRAGVPAYQLAVIVDDAAQGVTEVFRGDDLLASTPRQILIARALGSREPAWYHVPLVLDAQGRRLAKRADDLSLSLLREAGTDPRAILAWVADSAGFDGPDRVSARELCDLFELSRISHQPVTLTEAAIDELRVARFRART